MANSGTRVARYAQCARHSLLAPGPDNQEYLDAKDTRERCEEEFKKDATSQQTHGRLT
ncbi:hypothetical protein M378DRAFT_326628 [Amanita muscaria Koide BX008]|uniref:Uncharacterized protein n=1 Tax=Amanita muscaria (strain Koide BX008) TaxID=946122 RepID=A0A0C2XE29_AMAMK|nr:hypothetical protein M378DRAFT_326628 [Amanita muscaria Koide BX008]